MAIKCLSCGAPTARLTETGLECRGCGYAWTFQTEAQSAGYITAVLRRPVITPPVVEAVVVEPEPIEATHIIVAPALIDPDLARKVVKSTKGKG